MHHACVISCTFLLKNVTQIAKALILAWWAGHCSMFSARLQPLKESNIKAALFLSSLVFPNTNCLADPLALSGAVLQTQL